jgi:hypothetical protein
MARQPVVSTPPAPRPVNLRTSARLVDDGFRWEQGISLLPETCFPGGSEDPCAGPVEAKASGTATELVEWDPYGIYTYEQCAYAVNDDLYPELRAKAIRSLEAQTSHLVEQILWTNVVDGVDFGATHPNISLNEATTVGTQAPPTSALQQLDALLITALGGRNGMIHVPAPLMHFFKQADLITLNGNIWQTASGNIVVPGTGYDGSDSGGDVPADSLWIYGTSMVELRLGEIVVLPGDIRSAVNRATNQIVVRAERLALAYWDLCAHVGVPVCTTDPGPDCGPVS